MSIEWFGFSCFAYSIQVLIVTCFFVHSAYWLVTSCHSLDIRSCINMNATHFFGPPFLKAISENTEESLYVWNVSAKVLWNVDKWGFIYFSCHLSCKWHDFPCILVCALQSSDCLGRKYGKMSVWSQVPYNLSEHYEQLGVVLDDSGLETMLEKLMDDYTCPMSRGFASLFNKALCL
jgi:hypothetical protein